MFVGQVLLRGIGWMLDFTIYNMLFVLLRTGWSGCYSICRSASVILCLLLISPESSLPLSLHLTPVFSLQAQKTEERAATSARVVHVTDALGQTRPTRRDGGSQQGRVAIDHFPHCLVSPSPSPSISSSSSRLRYLQRAHHARRTQTHIQHAHRETRAALIPAF